MNDQADTERTAARLRAALSSAADVMVIRDAPERQHVMSPNRAKRAPRSWGRLAPIAAAAGVVVIAAGTVIGTHLSSHSAGAPASHTSTPTAAGTGLGASKPEFYLTVTYPASGQNVLQFQVRRTDGGAVTSSKTIPAANVGWGGYLSSSAGDRTFYFAHYLCINSTAIPQTTFDRISVTSSGQISGFAAADRAVPGMVTSFAVSPEGSQVAYNALPGACLGKGFQTTGAASVSIVDLSTGAVKTWTDPVANTMVSQLSWDADGRTVIVNEAQRGPNRPALTVFALNAASGGGSLKADSTTLLQQQANCSTCVATAIAGPDGTLTELEAEATGQQSRVLVVRVPAAAGSPRTVLYSQPSIAPANRSANDTDLFADASGEWLLLWPAGSSNPKIGLNPPAGYLSGGHLHPLSGLARIFPQGITW